MQHCPYTSHCTNDILEAAYWNWREYKKIIPVSGLILLNDAMDSVVLVRGWNKGASWMFPRGKVDQGEEDLACAVRETYEETGFNAQLHGLIPQHGELKKLQLQISGQKVMLFICPNVPMDFPFETKARKEIGDIRWYKLTELPGWGRKRKGQDSAATATRGLKAFQVSPFLGELGRWIKDQRKIKDKSGRMHSNGHISQAEIEDLMTEEEECLATEEALEVQPVYRPLGTKEAATMEIQRLLNMQLPPPGSRSAYGVGQNQTPAQQLLFASSGVEQDKGKALLALLQQKQDTSQQTPHAAQPPARTPHTLMDQLYNAAPQPQIPQHHFQTQRLPPQGAYQTPTTVPTTSVHSDMNSQLLSMLAISKNSSDQARWQQAQPHDHQQGLQDQHVVNTQAFQHQQGLNQQQASNPQQTLNRQQQVLSNQQQLLTNRQQVLSNQQQVLNQQRATELASAATSNHTSLSHSQPQPQQANHTLRGAVPPVAGPSRSAQIPQQSHLGGLPSGTLNLPQQLVANLPKRSNVLDNAQLALLSAFKKGASAANGLASKDQFSQSPTTEHVRPSQQSQQPTVNATVLGSPYTGEARAHLGVQNGAQGTSMSHGSPQLAMAQAALRPRKATPLQQNALLSLFSQPSNSSPHTQGARPNLKENGAPRSPGQSLSEQRSFGFNAGLEPASTMPHGLTKGSHFPQLPYGAQRVAVRPKNAEQKTPQQQFATPTAQQPGAFRVDGASSDSRTQMLGSPITAYVGSSPYNNTVSPAQVGLHTPLPANTQVNPQRQQTLLSLFGKSSPAAAAPALRAEARRPVSGAQAPISPENERFLLDYLKGVTNSAQ